MIQWIANNIWTIIISIVLFGFIAAVIISLVRKKHSGKSVVCNCSSCPRTGMCQSHKNMCHNDRL